MVCVNAHTNKNAHTNVLSSFSGHLLDKIAGESRKCLLHAMRAVPNFFITFFCFFSGHFLDKAREMLAGRNEGGSYIQTGLEDWVPQV